MPDSPVLDPIADAVADRIWARLEARFAERESPRLISIVEAAERIGVKKTKLYSMISSGEFPESIIKRLGRRTLILSSELDRWISAH